jgi:hypothetical protein
MANDDDNAPIKLTRPAPRGRPIVPNDKNGNPIPEAAAVDLTNFGLAKLPGED